MKSHQVWVALTVLFAQSAFAGDACKEERAGEGLFLKESNTVQVLEASHDDGTSPEALVGHRADLVVSRTMAQRHLSTEWRFFEAEGCAFQEGCVAASGWRRILRFHTRIINQGSQNFHLGDPRAPENQDHVHYDTCHGHYHVKDWAEYALLNSRGGVVVTGRKQAFCLMDSTRVSGRRRRTYNCEYQGITAGWADDYAASLPCQWLDITDVPPGSYQLRLKVNPLGRFRESRTSNNTVTVPITIRADPREEEED